MRRQDLPNLISGLRGLLAPLVGWLLVEGRYADALWVFVVAGVSDGLDGFLAKRFHWESELGGVLDPLADKLLLVASFLALTWDGLIPVWLTALVVLRDVIIVAGASAYHLLIEPLRARPSLLSKLNTGLQIALVLAVILHQLYALPAWLLGGLTAGVTLATLSSGVDYMLVWGRRARRGGSGRPGPPPSGD